MLNTALRGLAALSVSLFLAGAAHAHHPMDGGASNLLAAASDHTGLGLEHLAALLALGLIVAIIYAAVKAGGAE